LPIGDSRLPICLCRSTKIGNRKLTFTATGANSLPHGSAMPMRGKSMTCRGAPHFKSSGLRPVAVIDRLSLWGGVYGKSKTCRASAWPSHVARISPRRLPHGLAEHHLRGARRQTRRLRMRFTQPGNLQQRFTRTREQPDQISFFRARLVHQRRPVDAGDP
jgi:hypothetical protein